MLDWLSQNCSTLLIGAALLAVIIAIIVYLIKNRRQGKGSCSCGCAGCPMSGSCHQSDGLPS